MNRHRTHSARSSSSSADGSSPALPELSLDASLQCLHREEDLSTSSFASIALSRVWLQEQEAESEETRRSSSGLNTSISAFRFPPTQSTRSLESHFRHNEPEETAVSSRPRTSRGMRYHKPFLSSSRTTSIASIPAFDAEHTPDQEAASSASFAEDGRQGGFGALKARHSGFDNHDRRSAYKQPSESNYDPAPKHIDFQAEESPDGVPTQRRQTSRSRDSAWSVLLAPMQTSPRTKSSTDDHLARSCILLPLLPSLSKQVKLLRSHLVEDQKSWPDLDATSAIDLFLHLNIASVAPSAQVARLTPRSWASIFARFNGAESLANAAPLPKLYRETGLPIAATIRYALTPTVPESSTSEGFVSPRIDSVKQGQGSNDSNPWLRREVSTARSPATAGHDGSSGRMTASRSFPGAIALERFVSSPHHSSAVRCTTGAAKMSPADSTPARLVKLRPLSLAAAHRLGPSVVSTPLIADSRADQEARKIRTSTNAPKKVAKIERVEDAAWNERSHHQRYQSSQRSSHSSFPSHAATSSTSSRASASEHTSQTSPRTTSERFHDSGESDRDLGSRFWTHLSSLGQLVSTQNQQALETTRQRHHHSTQAGSISSAASEASILDFSPLGILMPSDAVHDEDPKSSRPVDASSRSSLFPRDDARKESSRLLGRRRACSSMIPLTGWRAGDTDLRTSQESLSTRNLPQVLLIEPRRRTTDSALDSEPNDLVTPTVTTFQGRARALSFQPLPSAHLDDTFGDSEPRKVRHVVWPEAIGQLSKSHSHRAAGRRRTVDNAPLSGQQASPAPRSDEMQSSYSSLQDQGQLDTDAVPDQEQSSPLSGLFYDRWVEQVDGEVNGELGRRGSTPAV